ncbi:MAG: ABC transporter permease [Pseudorhodoplanes sp.]
MLRFILLRFAWFVPNTILLTFLLFAVLTTWVGSPSSMMLGEFASKEALAEMDRVYGFNDPVVVQYGRWLLEAVQGNFGRSYSTKQTVATMVGNALPVTIELSLWGIVLAGIASVTLNSITIGRRLLSGIITIVSIIGISVPNFMLGTSLAYFFAIYLQWLPTSAWVPWSGGVIDHFRHLILPVVTLSLFYFGSFSMVYRAEYKNVTNKLFVLVAKAKGISDGRVSMLHVMPNSALPIITYIGISLGQLAGGAVITEVVFSLPGVGRVFVTAIKNNDFPVILSVGMMVLAAMMLFNVIADIVLAWINPQVRLWK